LKRGPAVISLLKLADQAEPLRHAVQHLDGEIAEQRRRQQQDQREPTAWILISPHLHWCSLQDDPKLSVQTHTSRRRDR
jgi:hypothetical protein